ncbi:MAG: hypothetical protein ACXVAY_14695 [Mucilaginibacter sp.]
MSRNVINYLTYGFLAAFIIFAALATFRVNQGIDWDAALCIKMADNAQQHIAFNNYAHPNPANLNTDQYEYVTWWTPGQVILPSLIRQLTGVKINVACEILTFICLIIAATGVYKLYQQLIINQRAENISESSARVLLLVALVFTFNQSFFWGNLFVYDGGGILMLSYCPWFIYWSLKIKGINIYSLGMLLVLALLGFFLKAAFTNIFAGALFYLFLSRSILPGVALNKQDLKIIIVNALYTGATFLFYMAITKILFLSHNRNIAESSLGITFHPRVFTFPIVAPIFGFLGLDSLNRTYHWIIGCCLVIPIYYLLLRSKYLAVSYKFVLIGFLATSIVFFTMLYILGLDVSYGLRHYRVITILITPALFIVLWRFKIVKYAICFLTASYFIFNCYSFAKNLAISQSRLPSNTYSGFQTAYPAEVVNKIHSLDNLNHNGHDIFYFQSIEPVIALDVIHNRVLLEDNFITFGFKNQPRLNTTLYYGRNSGEIYVIYPLVNFKADSAKYLTRFQQYKRFETIYQTKGYKILKAVADN